MRDTWHGGWKNWHKVICRVCTKKGKQLANADALSRLPDSMTRCNCYRAGMTVRSLPCGGCRHCIRAHQEWGRFEDGVLDSSPRIGKCYEDHDSNWASIVIPNKRGEEQKKRSRFKYHTCSSTHGETKTGPGSSHFFKRAVGTVVPGIEEKLRPGIEEKLRQLA